MPRLFLLRHAKSSWSVPGQGDVDRPLNERGRLAAAAVGRFMADNGYQPDLVLSSPSARTRETLDHLLPCFPDRIATDYVRDLYEASVEGAFKTIAIHGDSAERLLVVGHNPSLHMLALSLCRDGEGDGRARLKAKFPTAALAVIDLPDGSWSSIRPGSGRLVAFVTPADLGLGAGD